MKPLWAVAGVALLGAAGAGAVTAAHVILPRDEEVGFGDGDAQAVSSADFVVNMTTDIVDAAPGDGVCATAEGECSLRAAVQEANALAGVMKRILLFSEFSRKNY
jgi:CSLREA domain-containing protein